jgi:ParB-like chromosome segregation protein Spo0J
MSTIRKLSLDTINATDGTQSRAALNQDTVSEYADALDHGAEFPPVIVFSDGSQGGNWLADGFHRYHAHREAGAAEIAAHIRTGTQRDAVLFSCGANAFHGLRRTNADKRQAVAMVLSDAEWQSKPETWVAEVCKVSRTLVRAMLEDLHLVEKHDAVRTVERNAVAGFFLAR